MMANQVRVECINKYPRNDPHRHITHIGGVNPDGGRWKLSEEDAIAGMKADKWAFYVSVGGHTVAVNIARSPMGREYLKTTADHYKPDNLLALPECPP
jgi:Protein of unknown function (DUF3892)